MYRIIPLNLGCFTAFPMNKLIYGDKSGDTKKTPITAYFVQGAGRNILIDTGPCSAEAAWKDHNFRVEINPGETITEALETHDVRPKEIDTIILTHLHWDHCYNLDQFPNAEIIVQKKEVLCAMECEPAFYKAYESPKSGFPAVMPWMPYIRQFRMIDGDVWIFPGIKCILLPGHSSGSQGVFIQCREANYMIPGDLISANENWCGISGHKHIPCGTVENLREYYDSFAKLDAYDAKYGIHVIPSHDYKALEQTVYC